MNLLPVFEVVCLGFDGGTDETDDRILWVEATNLARVHAVMADAKLNIDCVCELVPNHADDSDIDFNLENEPGRDGFIERVRSFM